MPAKRFAQTVCFLAKHKCGPPANERMFPMKKGFAKIALFLSLMLLVSALAGCGNNAAQNSTANAGAASTTGTAAGAKLKVGIILTTSGRGDKSFNDSALAGLDRAKAELGVEYKEIQPKDVADIAKSIEFLAKEKYDLVFAVGFNSASALKEVAPNYPDTKFVIIDYNFGDEILPNLKSLVFREEEGSFLAGVLAVEMSKTGVVGFVGGMESSLIKKFEKGFAAGVEAAKPGTEVIAQYVSADASGFNNPSRAKEIALNMISKNADIIYHAAGGSGQGMLEAVEEKGITAIGVDSNQNWVKPGHVIASMLKRVDNAVYTIVKEDVDGTLKMGDTQIYGLDVDGVGLTDLNELTPDEKEGISEADQEKILKLKQSIPQEVKDKIAKYKQEIIDGKIVVPFE